ncbi:hypothetical protein ANTQUA_LOCUS6873 [Anthophora quadrimaculata]
MVGVVLLCRPDLFTGLTTTSSVFCIGGAASGGCWCVSAPSTDLSCDNGLAKLVAVPAGRFLISIAAYPPQCGQLSANNERDDAFDDDDYHRRDDGHGGGGGDGTGDSHYDHDVEYVGDMCGCATSTRRGLGTAAGKSARRTKSSCSLHRTPGIR